MNNFSEQLVMEYFIGEGYNVSRTNPNNSKQKLVKEEIGVSDFLLTSPRGKKIYLEVKSESSPSFEKEQINFIKTSKKIVWVIVVSRIGSFIILEIDSNLDIKIIKKGFFEMGSNPFYLFGRRLTLYDLRKNYKIRLEKHLTNLESIRVNRKTVS